MTYRLRVSSNELEDEMEEGEGEGETEFVVESKSGVLPPNCHQAIQVHRTYIFLHHKLYTSIVHMACVCRSTLFLRQ